MKTKPLFAFGHGLSYTTFSISNLRLDKKHDDSQRQPEGHRDRVTNTARSPAARWCSSTFATRRHRCKTVLTRTLKGFNKVMSATGRAARRDHQPSGATALSFYDETTHSWKLSRGRFEALIGNASDNITPEKGVYLQ
jgi:beta-glucosidase